MKCPYCNYVSFEYLTSCKKCSKDLSAHKAKHGISIIEPIAILAGAGAGAAFSMGGGGGDFGTDDFASDSSSDIASGGALETAVGESDSDDFAFGDAEGTEEGFGINLGRG